MTAERIWIDIPATAAYLHLLSACIADLLERLPDLDDPEQLTYSIQLAAQEISTNIVRHAYAESEGRIAVHLAIEPDPPRLVIELHDRGAPFDPSQVPLPDLDSVNVHGYGMFLARALLDELRYEALPGENRWRLVKHLTPGA